MRRGWTAALMAGVVAVGAAGCGGSQTSSSSSQSSPPSGASAPRAAAAGRACAGPDLELSYAGTEGATGHLEVTVAVRNKSSRPCSIRGYPGVRLVGAGGQVLPLRVVRGHGFFPDTMPAPATVAVAPGARAHLGLSFTTNNEYAGARVCRTAAAALLRLPGWSGTLWQRVSLRRGVRIQPCGSRLVVSPIHA